VSGFIEPLQIAKKVVNGRKTMMKENLLSIGADTGKKLQGAVLVDMWAIWSSENKGKLEKGRQKKPSLVAFIF